jgi:cytochrome c biogenesis protein CcmG/thiol:disulfide interchange protein DsbE
MTERLASLLAADEREAVCGDLAESGGSGVLAFTEISGLVARRHWHAWLGLLMALVGGTLLRLSCVRLAEFFYLRLWVMRNYADLDESILREIGLLWGQNVILLVKHSLVLAVVAWVFGVCVGEVRKRAAWAVVVVALSIQGLASCGASGRFFYDLPRWVVLLPFVLQALLVVLPAVLGTLWRRVPPAAMLCGALLCCTAPMAQAADGGVAPDFRLKDAGGRMVQLSAYRGKVVLLDFWATWCGGCKQEIPWYVEFDRKYRAKGLVVIGVSTDDSGMKVVKPFLAQHGIEYPVVMGTEEMEKQYHLDAMPLTLLIGRDGKISITHAGVVDRADFERRIVALLK